MDEEPAIGPRVGDLRIRTADPAEFPELGRLTLAAYAAGGHVDPEGPYGRQLADPAGRVAGCDLLVAVLRGAALHGAALHGAAPDGRTAGGRVADGRIVGGVSLVRPGSPQAEVAGPGEAEVRMLAVAPDAQRRGVAAALVTECLARARAAGYAAVVLCVVAANEPAHRLYRRFGFIRAPGRDWRPEPDVDLRAYALDLSLPERSPPPT